MVEPESSGGRGTCGGGPFVGRQQAMRELRGALACANSGQPRVVFLAGTSGIGKTRTAEEIANCARARGGQVLWGRCYEDEGAPAYWPWVQIVRAHIQGIPAAECAREMGSGAVRIAQVIPEVREHLPDLPESPMLEPERARFQFFDSIAAFLQRAARTRLLLLILDDLHSADTPSVLLLQFLARQVRDARLLILGTYRDGDLGRHHPLFQALGDLGHESLTHRIVLRGLTARDVGRFIALATGISPPSALVRTVHEQTAVRPARRGSRPEPPRL